MQAYAYFSLCTQTVRCWQQPDAAVNEPDERIPFQVRHAPFWLAFSPLDLVASA